MQILQHTISKNVPKLLVFNDFDFRMALSSQPGADSAERNFKKRSETPIFLLLTSERLSRHSLVQILWNTISKSAPKLSVFNDFDIRIALWPQPGADFATHNLKKYPKTLSF